MKGLTFATLAGALHDWWDTTNIIWEGLLAVLHNVFSLSNA